MKKEKIIEKTSYLVPIVGIVAMVTAHIYDSKAFNTISLIFFLAMGALAIMKKKSKDNNQL